MSPSFDNENVVGWLLQHMAYHCGCKKVQFHQHFDFFLVLTLIFKRLLSIIFYMLALLL